VEKNGLDAALFARAKAAAFEQMQNLSSVGTDKNVCPTSVEQTFLSAVLTEDDF